MPFWNDVTATRRSTGVLFGCAHRETFSPYVPVYKAIISLHIPLESSQIPASRYNAEQRSWILLTRSSWRDSLHPVCLDRAPKYEAALSTPEIFSNDVDPSPAYSAPTMVVR